MRRINIKLILTSFFVVVVFFSVFQVAKAALGAWICHSRENIQGSSIGYACKMVRRLHSLQWAGDIVSYTNNPPVSMVLGWTYFTTRETCNGNFRQQTIKAGTSVYGNQIANTTFMNTMQCAGTRFGFVLGKHEFKNNNNVVVWAPEWTHGVQIP